MVILLEIYIVNVVRDKQDQLFHVLVIYQIDDQERIDLVLSFLFPYL